MRSVAADGAEPLASVDVVDAIGTAPRSSAPAGDVLDFACVGGALWLLAPGQLRRGALEGHRPLSPPQPLPAGLRALTASTGEHLQAALLLGDAPCLVSAQADALTVDEVEVTDDERAFPLQGRRVAVAGPRGLRFVEGGREVERPLPLEGGALRDVRALFGGRALALLTGEDGRARYRVVRPDGSLIHKLELPPLTRWAVADTRGVAVALDDRGALLQIDLRYGRVLAAATPPGPVEDLDLDADGQFLVLAGPPDRRGVASVVHLAATEVFAAGSAYRVAVAPTRREAATPSDAPDAPDAPAALDEAAPAAPTAPPEEDVRAAASTVESHLGQQLSAAPLAHAVDAAARAAEPDRAPAAPEAVVVPDALPLALGAPLPPLRAEADPEWPPYAAAHEHLEGLLEVVAAQAGKAIAEAWNSGRLSAPADDQRPFEREVRALLGHVGGYAAELVTEAAARLARAAAASAGRGRSSIAAGLRLPFVELAREFQLSSTAAQVLMVAVAPMLRGEIARLFGVLGNDEHRPLVDRHLIELVVAGADPAGRLAVSRELAEDAPLVRCGLVRITDGEPGVSLFAGITVDAVLVERLRGRVLPTTAGEVSLLQRADRTLDELQLPARVKRELVLALAAPRAEGERVRVVLRGRRGSGRHAVIAALAARVDRGIVRIDASRLPRDGVVLAARLRQELLRALLRSCVPVVSGLELADPADSEGQERLKQVLRAHPGPVVIRAAPEATLPLEPGFVTVHLPPLLESERAAFWRAAVTRAGLPTADVDALAARYRVGPGVIEHVVAQVVARRAHEPGAAAEDAAAQLDEVAAQHIDTRLTHIAQRVQRLPRWEQVALPGDLIDSIREFIARISQRRTVYDTWGFSEKMSSSRGLTALFYGPPGTGKTMVAGLIARELGLELYRIDLARIVSKWIGETEKNLAEVFDAAEDGQVVIVFDEADSLFAKRTEVKSSVDRYANLEVNYLLQRLDTFEGIAILTTNLEGSIDPAFKRRMSLRLQFPFPDEEMRTRLWASHIPSAAPVRGDFDFAELARRFPLSGGYIRNSTLRAAFLAAQEQRPLSQEHLLRAIALEYRELGKLSTSGRME
ncbi:MAG: ATP-binding protein [Kofleriaceae bacterium]